MTETGEEFYITLPSNGALSMNEFPDNKNYLWKTRLPKYINLEGEWEVGLANVSYPSESKLQEYLSRLSDGHTLLKTGRILWNESKNRWEYSYFSVSYGDIKHYNLFNLQDVFEALFSEEMLKVLRTMDSSTKFRGNGNNGQFLAYKGNDCFSCGFFVDRSTIDAPISGVVEDNIRTIFERSFLQTFNFVELVNVTFQGNTKLQWKPTANLKLRFSDDSRGWSGRQDVRFLYKWYYGLEEVKDDDWSGIKIRYDLNATFLNLKNLSHKKSSEERPLFIYSSLCEPQDVGEDTRELLCHASYQPSLKGGGMYEPKTIQYRGLRTQQFQVIKTELREEDEEHLAKFASGATIVSLHLRRVK